MVSRTCLAAGSTPASRIAASSCRASALLTVSLGVVLKISSSTTSVKPHWCVLISRLQPLASNLLADGLRTPTPSSTP